MTSAPVSGTAPRQRPVRVMIADDDVNVRAALIDLIGDETTLAFVGAAGDTDSAVAMARAQQPDVAVLDVQMPGAGGVHAARELRRLCPGTIVIGLSSYGDRATRAAMLGAGVARFLVKGSPDTDLVAAIGDVVAERWGAQA
jgi:DNA-binding NarL/FixJ family response regulator